MINPEEKLRLYRDQLYRDVVTIFVARLRFLEELGHPKNSALWGGAHSTVIAFFYRSLFDNLIVSLSWLFSESKSDKRSLRWYLSQVREHTKVFSEEEISEQFALLRLVEEKSKLVKRVRDSWLAHRDPNAFNDPKGFLAENKITLKDFSDLVSVIQTLLSLHFARFNETHLVFEIQCSGVDLLAHLVGIGVEFRESAFRLAANRGSSDFEQQKMSEFDRLLGKYGPRNPLLI